MNEIKHSKIENIVLNHKCQHEGYEYYKQQFISLDAATHTVVRVYEIRPSKSAYPFHYHYKNEETFCIISGKDILKTLHGERMVEAGELLFFQPGLRGHTS